MLNNLSVLNKIYPQSQINHDFANDYANHVYVVKMWASYYSELEVYCFESLEKALNAVRECYSAYPNHLSFEVVPVLQIFSVDDSINEIKFSESINYEF